MRIITSKKECQCFFCLNKVDLKYRVLLFEHPHSPADWEIHLSCYKKVIKILGMTKETEPVLKELQKPKYQRQISLELLKKGLNKK